MNSIVNIDTWCCTFERLGGKGDAEIYSKDGKVLEILYRSRNNALIRSPQYAWLIEFGGFFTKEFCVFEQESGEEIALIERKFIRNFALIFRDSPEKRWFLKRKRWQGLWNRSFSWENELGDVLMTFTLPFNPFSRQLEIAISSESVGEKNTLFFVGVGIYLMRFVRNRK